MFVLKDHKKQIANLFSNKKGISPNWVGKIVNGVVIIWIVVFIIIFLKQIIQIKITLNWFFIVIRLFVSYIGYHGFKQQMAFEGLRLVKKVDVN